MKYVFYSKKGIHVQSQQQNHLINLFESNFPFLHLLKTSENQRSTSIVVLGQVIAHRVSVLVFNDHYEIVYCVYFYCQKKSVHCSKTVFICEYPLYSLAFTRTSHLSFTLFTPNLCRSNNSLKIFQITNHSEIFQESLSISFSF